MLSSACSIANLLQQTEPSVPDFSYTGTYTATSVSGYASAYYLETSGTITFSNKSSCSFQLVGGGAGGGTAQSGGTGTLRSGANGGNGGTTTSNSYSSLSNPSSISITIGAGGAGYTTAATVGDAGGTTSISCTGQSTYTAVGGTGGRAGVSGTQPAAQTGNGSLGGRGQNDSANAGDGGATVQLASNLYVAGGGGGGVRNSVLAGAYASPYGTKITYGTGGKSISDGGLPPYVTYPDYPQAANGPVYGCGGCGGGGYGGTYNGTNQKGGDGAPGVVLFYFN